MLQSTFLHIQGIGPKTETRLWASGLTDWALFHSSLSSDLPRNKRQHIADELHNSEKALAGQNAGYFARRLPAGQHWRLFPEFRGYTAYLDIETTGLEADCAISTIALYDGVSMHTYVNGQNFDAFVSDISRYKLLVTYNGKCFDVPVIERVLGCRLDQAHIDLRYVLAALGFKGGLKRCESLLGLERGNIADVDGLFAVVLWKAYLRNGDETALETLLAYNLQDAINLEALMVTAYNLSIERTPFGREGLLSEPMIPSNPFTVHPAAISRYRREVEFLRSLQSQW